MLLVCRYCTLILQYSIEIYIIYDSYANLLPVQAVMHADDVMENICAIGVIDGDACRHQLSKHGINDEERLDLQPLGCMKSPNDSLRSLENGF